MEKTSRIQSTSLLISKKAYNDFTERLRRALGAVSQNPRPIEEAIALFDRYVKGEIFDFDSDDLMVKLTLMMLKSEIDKAMRRSSAARERARLRHAKLAPVSESHENTKSPENPENPENSRSAERPMNRRERREYEQELAREQRRWERHLKRMRG